MPEKTVAEKARLKPDATIALVDAEREVLDSLGIPDSVTVAGPEAAQHVLFFARSKAQFESRFAEIVDGLAPGAAVWVFFRKGSKAAGLDLTRDVIWAEADRFGLRPLGVMSVDATWSVFRLRPAK